MEVFHYFFTSSAVMLMCVIHVCSKCQIMQTERCFSNNTANHSEAEEHCQSVGVNWNLANGPKVLVHANHTGIDRGVDYHVGLTKRPGCGAFTYPSGREIANSSVWDKNVTDPDNSTHQCATIRIDVNGIPKASPANCSRKTRYVCHYWKIPYQKLISCNQTGQFLHHPQRLTFTDAMESCKKAKCSMLTENDFYNIPSDIRKTWSVKGIQMFWSLSGTSGPSVIGIFSTTSSTNQSQRIARVPISNVTCSTVQFNNSNPAGMVNDVQCQIKHPFLCFKQFPRQSTNTSGPQQASSLVPVIFAGSISTMFSTTPNSTSSLFTNVSLKANKCIWMCKPNSANYSDPFPCFIPTTIDFVNFKTDPKNTSLYKRKKGCAYDDRFSARIAGFTGVVVLCVCSVIIVLMDVSKYCMGCNRRRETKPDRGLSGLRGYGKTQIEETDC